MKLSSSIHDYKNVHDRYKQIIRQLKVNASARRIKTMED